MKYAHPSIPKDLYERLKNKARELGLSVPELLEKLLESYEVQAQQPKATVTVKDMWVYIELDNERVALNTAQAGKMCRLKILPEHLCREVKARIPWL